MAAKASRGEDLALWAAEQARLLREGRFAEADVPGLADEVERLGLRQGEALRGHLAALSGRLLLWKYLPGARLPVWRADIAADRQRIARLLAASPSLADRPDADFADAYRLARTRAAAEAGIAAGVLPEAPPFSPAEARDDGFLPLEPSLESARKASQP